MNVDGRLTLADARGPFGNPTSDSARTMVTLDHARAVRHLLPARARSAAGARGARRGLSSPPAPRCSNSPAQGAASLPADTLLGLDARRRHHCRRGPRYSRMGRAAAEAVADASAADVLERSRRCFDRHHAGAGADRRRPRPTRCRSCGVREAGDQQARRFVEGGARRQDSVANGFDALSAEAQYPRP